MNSEFPKKKKRIIRCERQNSEKKVKIPRCELKIPREKKSRVVRCEKGQSCEIKSTAITVYNFLICGFNKLPLKRNLPFLISFSLALKHPSGLIRVK